MQTEAIIRKRISRGMIRVISYLTAACVALGAVAYNNYSQAKQYRANLEYTYMRSLNDLTDYMANIQMALSKGTYANTAPQQYGLTAKLTEEASLAKSALGQLPLADVELNNVNRFLSQVGDYASYLSSSLSRGQALNEEEISNLISLGDYAGTLLLDLQDLLARFDGGGLYEGEAAQVFQDLSNQTQSQEEPLISSGFREMNEGFTDYPTLIYDGPFSDHILLRTSKMLEGQAEVDAESARMRAADLTGAGYSALQLSGETGGNLPCYTFSGGGTTVSVTKAGGYPNEMLSSRMVSTGSAAQLSPQEAVEKAKNFLSQHGMEDMKESYYQTSNGVCTINFAAQQEGAVCYSDLVKVGVALDNGDIISYNATGYLMNHTGRQIPQQVIPQEQAQQNVSPRLTVESVATAFIPTPGLDEVYCYEFTCSAENGDRVLVYINAQTGLEEQIYILLQSDGGTLVM